MSAHIDKLKLSVKRDEEHIQELQDGLKSKREKIKELEDAETLNNLNALKGQGLKVDDIIIAIKNKNLDALTQLMAEEESEKGENNE